MPSVHTAVHILGNLPVYCSMPSVHTAVHRQVTQNVQQQMPGWVLVVMLWRIALWETVGDGDWSDELWGFPQNQYKSDFLVFTCNTLHTTFLAKSVHTTRIVYSFENRFAASRDAVHFGMVENVQ